LKGFLFYPLNGKNAIGAATPMLMPTLPAAAIVEMEPGGRAGEAGGRR
jgi:hypothetical protein